MIGSFLTRGLVMVFGYAYPAYECFKTVEKNKPEIEQLRFWCQYWILVAVLTVCERIGDTFISWVPMYSEAKLAFYIYLWFPKTKGTTYVYDSFFRPYVAKHEPEIDRNLLELRTRAGDIAILYWQKSASYAQTRVFDILQYIASQSTTRPRPVQPQQQQQQADRVRLPNAAANRQTAPSAPPQIEEPPSPTSSKKQQEEIAKENVLTQAPPPKPASSSSETASNASKAASAQPAAGTVSRSNSNEVEAMQIETATSLGNEASSGREEMIMEETIRVTRGRLRKTKSGGGK